MPSNQGCVLHPEVPVATSASPAKAVWVTPLLVDVVMGMMKIPAKPLSPSASIPSKRTQRTMAEDIPTCFPKLGRMAKLAIGQWEVFVNTL